MQDQNIDQSTSWKDKYNLLLKCAVILSVGDVSRSAKTWSSIVKQRTESLANLVLR